mgnify:FL=1
MTYNFNKKEIIIIKELIDMEIKNKKDIASKLLNTPAEQSKLEEYEDVIDKLKILGYIIEKLQKESK